MYAVALVALGTPIEVEAPLLAAELGAAPYDTMQILRRTLPTVTLRTPDRAAAVAHLEGLVRRGHHAVGLAVADVISSAQMGEVKGFAFEPTAVRFELRGRPAERVPYDDLLCLVRAVHRTSERTTTVTKERAFDFKKFAATGGAMMTKTVEKEKVSESEEREPVLYVFRRGGTPILLAATRAKYIGLGAEVRPTQLANFERTTELLRARAPHAPYDARLVAVRTPAAVKMGLGRGQESASSADTMDLLAHVVAMTLVRAATPPYRAG